MPKEANVYTSLHHRKKNCYCPFFFLPYLLSCRSASSTTEAPTGNRTQAFHLALDWEFSTLPSRPAKLLMPTCKNSFLNHMLVAPGWIRHSRDWKWATDHRSRHSQISSQKKRIFDVMLLFRHMMIASINLILKSLEYRRLKFGLILTYKICYQSAGYIVDKS